MMSSTNASIYSCSASVTRAATITRKGIYTAIASGRGILECQKKLRLSNWTYVTLNGSYVTDRKENVIYEERLPNPLVQGTYCM